MLVLAPEQSRTEKNDKRSVDFERWEEPIGYLVGRWGSVVCFSAQSRAWRWNQSLKNKDMKILELWLVSEWKIKWLHHWTVKFQIILLDSRWDNWWMKCCTMTWEYHIFSIRQYLSYDAALAFKSLNAKQITTMWDIYGSKAQKLTFLKRIFYSN